METLTKSYSPKVADLKKFVYNIILQIDDKLVDLAVVDIFKEKVVVYYTWTWYKKKLKRTGELGRPFIIRENDLRTKKGGISMSKRDELLRKLVNYFIYQRENGKSFKVTVI